MKSVFIIIAAFAAGTAAGGFLALFMGKPVKAGKPSSFIKRQSPAVLGLLLLIAVFCFGGVLPEKTRLFLIVFSAAFCIALAGTVMGLEKRDPKLMELAFVFRIPAVSRIRYIDLPAARPVMIPAIVAAGVVSVLLGVLDILMKGGAF